MDALGDARIDNAKQALAEAGRRLVGDRLAIGSAGNLSIRVDDFVAITPSGVSYGDIEPEDICVLTMTGDVVSGRRTPSSETPMHLAIYGSTSAGAVVHTHSPEVVAISTVAEELPAVHYAIARLGGPVRVVPYARFGSDALARTTEAALAQRYAAILQNHGAVTYGRDLEDAYERALLLEWLASVYRLARATGEPRVLSTAELGEVVAESRRRRYGETRDPATAKSQRESARPASPEGAAATQSGTPAGAAATASPALGRVVSFGAHILDVLGRPVAAVPPGEGALRLDEIRATAAGTAAATSIDLAKLGASVRSIGAIGDDALGYLVSALLTQHGVDVSLLVTKKDARTSATILPIRPDGGRLALHAPGADRLFAPADLSAAHWEAIAAADVLHIGGPDSLRAFDAPALANLVRRAKDRGAVVTLDVLRPGDESGLQRLAPVLSLVDWFLPNEAQLRGLTGSQDLEKAAGLVRDLGAGGVAVSCGADGAVVTVDGGCEHIRALPVAVADTTGCGDGFDAGFIAGLLLGCPPVECAWLATACGALVATALGSDAGISSLSDTLDLLEKHEPEEAHRIRGRFIQPPR